MTIRRPRGSRSQASGSGRRRDGTLTLLPLVVTLAVIGGCRGSGQMASETRPLRTDVEWQLVTMEPVAPPAVTLDPTRYTVRFGADGSVSVRADCNRCAARYRIEGATLTVGPALACTRAACALPSLGDRFTAALTTVSRYVQRERDLDLVHAGGTLRFRTAP